MKISSPKVQVVAAPQLSNEVARKLEVDAKYTKPTGGIPSSDLDSAVQATLGAAVTHITDVSGNPHEVKLQQAADKQGTTNTHIASRLYLGNATTSEIDANKYLTASEIAALYSSGMTYKGVIKYGAYTIADRDKITTQINGDRCGVHETQLTYEWDSSGSTWTALPHGNDSIGDLYLIEFYYGTVNGVTYTGEVQGEIICREVSPSSIFDVYLDTTILLDNSVTDSKIGNRTIATNNVGRPYNDGTPLSLTNHLQGLQNNSRYAISYPVTFDKVDKVYNHELAYDFIAGFVANDPNALCTFIEKIETGAGGTRPSDPLTVQFYLFDAAQVKVDGYEVVLAYDVGSGDLLVTQTVAGVDTVITLGHNDVYDFPVLGRFDSTEVRWRPKLGLSPLDASSGSWSAYLTGECYNEVPISGGGSGTVTSVDNVQPSGGGGDIPLTQFVTSAQYNAMLANPSLMTEGVRYVTDDTLMADPIHVPIVSWLGGPDYSNMETTNRITAIDGTWTVTADGYCVAGFMTPAETPHIPYNVYIYVNNKQVSVIRYTIVEGLWTYRGLVPVSKGDIIRVSMDSPNAGYSAFCYFVPPKVKSYPSVYLTGVDNSQIQISSTAPDYTNGVILPASVYPTSAIANSWNHGTDWTVPEDGYIAVSARTLTPNTYAAINYACILVNGYIVIYSDPTTNGANIWIHVGTVAVNKGDKVKMGLYTNAAISTFVYSMERTLFFPVKPRYVTTPTVIDATINWDYAVGVERAVMKSDGTPLRWIDGSQIYENVVSVENMALTNLSIGSNLYRHYWESGLIANAIIDVKGYVQYNNNTQIPMGEGIATSDTVEWVAFVNASTSTRTVTVQTTYPNDPSLGLQTISIYCVIRYTK